MTVTAPPRPPRPPEPDELEALIEEARRRARRRRRGYAAVIGVAVLVGVVVYGFVARGAGGGARSGGGRPAGGLSVPQSVRPGQFFYTRTLSTWHESRPAGGEYQAKVFMRARGPMVAFDVRVTSETWVGLDGTVRQRTLVLSARFASPAGRARWSAYHRPVPNFSGDIDSDSIMRGDGLFAASGSSGDPLGPQDIGDGAFSHRQLVSLPTQPVALRDRIQQAFAALARRRVNSAVDRCGYSGGTYVGRAGCKPAPPAPARQRRANLASQEMTEIGQMLSWPLPGRLRLALFHAALTLPAVSSDVTVDPHARDPLGRPGVAVTASPPDPMRLVFDPATGELLAQPGFGGEGVVTAQGVVDGISAVPAGVGQIHAPDAPPQPPGVAIVPRVGLPNTVFSVTVSAGPGTRAHGRAPRLGGGVSGPVYPRCSSGFSTPTPPTRPPFLSFPGTARRQAGHLAYIYRLTPPTGTGHRWCAGRYQLQLDTSGFGPPGPSGAGTAVFFDVK